MRVDGLTGDTCANGLPLEGPGLVTPSWGPTGLIAAESSGDIVLVASDGSPIILGGNEPYPVVELVHLKVASHNPAFAPLAYVPPVECQ